MARAATSGWKTGGNGRGRPASLLRDQSNCGVFTAGRWTCVTRTRERAWRSSTRSDSVNAFNACLAAQ